MTTVLEKLAITHVTPSSGPVVALASTALTVVLLTPGALFTRQTSEVEREQRGAGLQPHLGALCVAAVIAGIAPLFGFTAIALGHVGYVTALFKLGAVFTPPLGAGGAQRRIPPPTPPRHHRHAARGDPDRPLGRHRKSLVSGAGAA